MINERALLPAGCTSAAVAIALDHLDAAARAEEGGMSTGCEVHVTCRTTLTRGRSTDIEDGDPAILRCVEALRLALLLAAQHHAETLTGRVHEPISLPWEDRESSADRVRMLCHLLADAVSTAAALGVLRLEEEEG